MKKGLLLGSLITGCAFFSMQASSAMQTCPITLRTDSYHYNNNSYKMGKLADYTPIGDGFKPGDIVQDIEINFGWSHKMPKDVRLDLNHVNLPGGNFVHTDNQLWAEDVNSTWEMSNRAIKTEIIKRGIVSFSGVGPLSSKDAHNLNIFGGMYYRFNVLNKEINVPVSWCNPTVKHYVKIYPHFDAFNIPEVITVNVLRAKTLGDPVDKWVPTPVILLDLMGATYREPITVPYDIVRNLKIEVPPVVDFGRVDTGVVAKKDIDVRLTSTGVPARGLLTFSYAGAQNMEVTVKEKSESQDTPLPYSKSIDQFPSDKMSLSYQIGVKSDTTGDKEQLVLVIFQVF
ncbi:hypothetical protein ABQ37_004546 [Salmonella enterica subsp. enterica serovar Sandiego]|uniref:Fimbrial protein n=1 Tax=Salmonella enterica TaxID=28901 RepID=A0A743ISL1_SALER|nr:hypothetical protein [Salmonella enterica]EAT8420893.1 hypothetical protein [Salmonella enterica subsp. enterica serovar Chester]EDQ9820230.1 hypothetical protein [Salmonella enterica subsp. enterica]EDR2949225.1 hypothetical protein [Salmonella enterica subsp. enterica serovar Sandiego]EAT8233366.1 hypothetical protein [Salmonella enterica]